jgi:hypothetical protein
MAARYSNETGVPERSEKHGLKGARKAPLHSLAAYISRNSSTSGETGQNPEPWSLESSKLLGECVSLQVSESRKGVRIQVSFSTMLRLDACINLRST